MILRRIYRILQPEERRKDWNIHIRMVSKCFSSSNVRFIKVNI